MLFNYTHSQLTRHVVVYGCGGTGSRLIPMVAQFLKSCDWLLSPEMTIVDFDVVETKNLSRQNFVAADVGKNKAVALATRYSKAYGVPIEPITVKVSIGDDLLDDSNVERTQAGKLVDKINSLRSTIHVMCVDTPEARREILKFILCNDLAKCIIIDTGNEDDFGQVTWSNGVSNIVNGVYRDNSSSQETLDSIKYAVDQLKDSYIQVPLPAVPFSSSYYLDMKPGVGGSCATLDQTMAINAMVATAAFSIIQNLIYFKPIGFNRINISLTHGSQVEYMDHRFIEALINKNLNEETNYKTGTNIEALHSFSGALSLRLGDLLEEITNNIEPEQEVTAEE